MIPVAGVFYLLTKAASAVAWVPAPDQLFKEVTRPTMAGWRVTTPAPDVSEVMLVEQG